VDIPCGDARNTIALAKAQFQVLGADSSSNALKLASRAVIKNNAQNNCLLLKSDIFDTQFSSEQFENILCWDVLGHLEDPISALNELLRITRTGGRIIASVFSTGDSTMGKEMDLINESNNEYILLQYFLF
jgi:ubiquinone/menaquinone biosynthesis C-methylase UbiE